MSKKNNSPVRLNIYINNPVIRRKVKTAAANQDISVSEYCLRAITLKLMEDGEIPFKEEPGTLKTAVEKAHRFRAETFGRRIFTVSSAALIREAREYRNKL